MTGYKGLYYGAAAATTVAGMLHLMLNITEDEQGYLGAFNVVVEAG